jgi:hypothetical protein
MSLFIVRTGLSRRLVEANSTADALRSFVYDRPSRSALSFEVGEDLDAHLATPLEVAEFAKKRPRRKAGPGQLALALDDECGARRPRKRHP